jgi:hypothetical protein
MKLRKHFPFLIAILLLTACASQPAINAYDPPHFFNGLWHGLIAPFAFFASLFSSDIRIYSFPNVGCWYDFGFLIGFGWWGLVAGS